MTFRQDFNAKLFADVAPSRLARSDVAALRDLYRRAVEARHSEAFHGTASIFFTRDKAQRGLARLGAPQPRCYVQVRWRKEHEWGLDTRVTAHGADGNTWITVAEHRFRSSTTEAQFCRSVSRYVRHGLGWAVATHHQKEQT